MKPKTDKLAQEYFKAEQALFDHLGTLPKWSNECECEAPEDTVYLIFDEYCATQYCLDCGGYIPK